MVRFNQTFRQIFVLIGSTFVVAIILSLISYFSSCASHRAFGFIECAKMLSLVLGAVIVFKLYLASLIGLGFAFCIDPHLQSAKKIVFSGIVVSILLLIDDALRAPPLSVKSIISYPIFGIGGAYLFFLLKKLFDDKHKEQ